MSRVSRRPSADDRLDAELRDHVERQVAYQTSPVNGAGYGAAAAVVLVVAAIAAGLPASRAARVSPLTALRHE